MMKMNILGTTIYQQSVLTYIYYYGKAWYYEGSNSGPWNWHKQPFYEGPDHEATPKL
jgi:hypothetical protein